MLACHGEDWEAELADERAAAAAARSQHGPVSSAASGGSQPPEGTASPGSGRDAGPQAVDSWKSSAPGSPGTLTSRTALEYEPERESVEVYETRLRRQVEVLDTMGYALPVGSLEKLIIKARVKKQLNAVLVRQAYCRQDPKLRIQRVLTSGR